MVPRCRRRSGTRTGSRGKGRLNRGAGAGEAAASRPHQLHQALYNIKKKKDLREERRQREKFYFRADQAVCVVIFLECCHLYSCCCFFFFFCFFSPHQCQNKKCEANRIRHKRWMYEQCNNAELYSLLLHVVLLHTLPSSHVHYVAYCIGTVDALDLSIC